MDSAAQARRRRRPGLWGDAALAALFVAVAAAPWGLWLGRRIELRSALAGPSLAHPFGADSLGRDLLVRVSEALQSGVLPLWGGVAAGTALGLGLAVAALSAAQRPALRPAVAALDVGATALGSVPVGIMAFAWSAVQQEAGLLPVLLALSALFGVRAYLQARDLYRQDERLGYWTAHRALGGRLAGRLWRYGVLGGWRARLLETLGFHLRAAVAVEASLSYLGFGIQEPRASLGNMLAAHFDLYLRGQWQVLAVVVAALALTGLVPGRLLALGAAAARARRRPGNPADLPEAPRRAGAA